MKLQDPENGIPADGLNRRAVEPVVCYPADALSAAPLVDLRVARASAELLETVLVPARDARCFSVPQGHFFRISSVDAPQVGDLNLWNANNLQERFYAGKTRALHGTHLSTGDRMWSSFPALRAMASVIADTLDWYGFDDYGCSVHDVIGTRCDPYTHNLLSDGGQYHHCCHSNLTRALADYSKLPVAEAEALVHDVLNVFMCTGFSRQTGQYVMKASPVRPGDYIEFYAHIDLLGGLSACPGGDCSSEHSSDQALCSPLQVDIYKPEQEHLLEMQESTLNGYDKGHGLR